MAGAAGKVSIIVPTFNCGRYIAAAIESALRQTYTNHEIIVADDGSTDDTKDVLARYVTNGHVRHFVQANQGPGAARNLGIRMATGDYVAFLDADDELMPTSLEVRMALIRSAATAGRPLDVVFSNFVTRPDATSEHIAIDRVLPRALRRHSTATPHGVIIEGRFPETFEIPFMMWTGAVLISTSLVRAVGGFRAEMKVGEDRDLWIRTVEQVPRVGYVDAPLARYNVLKSQLTRRDPVGYVTLRKELNRRIVATYRSAYPGPIVARVVRKRTAWVHYDLATHYHGQGQWARGLLSALQAVAADPSNGHCWALVLRSMMPRSARATMRRLRERWSTER